MNKAGPTNITLSAIAGIYILAQVIIVPALPDLGIIFSSDYRTIQLSVSAFSIGAAIVNIIAGPLSDRFGRRPIAIGFFIFEWGGCRLIKFSCQAGNNNNNNNNNKRSIVRLFFW